MPRLHWKPGPLVSKTWKCHPASHTTHSFPGMERSLIYDCSHRYNPYDAGTIPYVSLLCKVITICLLTLKELHEYVLIIATNVPRRGD